jgi:uncharacterized membrane protein YebE (DUF533 family)
MVTEIYVKARGLIDDELRLEKLSQRLDLLEQLGAHIDFDFFAIH